MEFTDLITELKNLTTTDSIFIIGLCVFAGLIVLAIICELLNSMVLLLYRLAYSTTHRKV